MRTEETNITVKTRKKPGIAAVIGMILAFLFWFLSVLIALSLRWLLSHWSTLAMEEILIQVATSLGGTSQQMILSYLLSCLLPALILTGAAAVICFFFLRRRKKTVFFVLLVCLSVVLLLITGIVAWQELSISDFVDDSYSELIDDSYVAPETVDIRFPEKKNLVYIYLESMEVTYADAANGGAFPYNCIPELCELAQTNEDFSGSDQELNGSHVLPGSGWTIAAMISQTAGIPMQIGGNDMNMLYEFFPSLISLGDILKENGYTQELLLGSDAAFGGTDKLFSQHGDFLIADYSYAIENGWIDPSYYVWWGFEDEKLFSFAKSELLRLAEGDEPFNLTLATIDTHFPDGYTCRNCRDEFPDDPYANVMACSSRQVAQFVEWIQEQDFYPDTVIVLMGDHPTMDADFCDTVPGAYDRCVYTAYINSAAEPATQARRVYSTLDAFPTTLAAIGAEIPGDRLGLGTNLFSEMPTLCEVYGLDVMDQELRKNSHVIDALQLVPTLQAIQAQPTQVVQSRFLYHEAENHLDLDLDFSSLADFYSAESLDAGTIRLLDADRERLLSEISIRADGITTHSEPAGSGIFGGRNDLCIQVLRETGSQPLAQWRIHAKDFHPPAQIVELHLDDLFAENYIVRLTSPDTDDRAKPGDDTAGKDDLSVEITLAYEDPVQYTTTVAGALFPLYTDQLSSFLRVVSNSDYAVFISVYDEASNGLTEEEQQLFHELGLQEDLIGQFRSSYCAVIVRGTALTEQLGEARLESTGVLSDGTEYYISSSGYNTGCESQIKLNGIEYSPAERGLNIVVYDLDSGTVAVSRSFDTYHTPSDR